MMGLLEVRAFLRGIYQKFQVLIDPIVKFAIAYLVFTQINSNIGYDERFTKTSITLLLSLISAFTPAAVLVFLSIALVLVHVYYVSLFLSIFIAFALVILYCLFLRITPKYGLVVVAIPILSLFDFSYGVPMLLGLMATPLTILPAACGVFASYLFSIVKEAANRQVNLSLDDILQLYTDVIDSIMENKLMLVTIVVFAAVIVVVFLVRKISFEFSFEIAIAAGVVTNILGFLVGDLKFNLSIEIGSMILLSLLSGVVVLVIHWFYRLLDYTAVERVQFEDDDYYYYVKAVPKINIAKPDKNVKHINVRTKSDSDESEDYEDTNDIEDAVVTELAKGNLDSEMSSYGASRIYEEDYDDEAINDVNVRQRYIEPVIPEEHKVRNDEGLPTGEYDMEIDDGYEVEMTLDDFDDNEKK